MTQKQRKHAPVVELIRPSARAISEVPQCDRADAVIAVAGRICQVFVQDDRDQGRQPCTDFAALWCSRRFECFGRWHIPMPLCS